MQQLVVGQEKLGDKDYGPLYVRNVKDGDGHPQYMFLHIPCTDVATTQDGLRGAKCPHCILGALRK